MQDLLPPPDIGGVDCGVWGERGEEVRRKGTSCSLYMDDHRTCAPEVLPPHHAGRLCFRRRQRTASKHFLSAALAFLFPRAFCPT